MFLFYLVLFNFILFNFDYNVFLKKYILLDIMLDNSKLQVL